MLEWLKFKTLKTPNINKYMEQLQLSVTIDGIVNGENLKAYH
jgi:hypothetical protein